MSITRRQFLQTLVVTAGTLSAAGPALARQVTQDDEAGAANLFPLSVASGDPKPGSVVLWTRLADPRLSLERESLPLRVQVATSDAFRRDDLVVDAELDAFAANDGCVRVKVTGLSPRTYYYYRFVAYTRLGGSVTSRVGRTRTAPDSSDPVPVRFALASCQDYIGKYYNTYLTLLTPEYDDLDFLLHVGDFIYETSGDPSFQGGSADRAIELEDAAGAIAFRGDGGVITYRAARSLSNYRQLHRVYRSDPILQEILEKFPLIHMWDDHEFTDDSWRDHSTYYDGRGTLPDGSSIGLGDGSTNVDEQDTERRLNAERAFLEYIPVDDEDLSLDGPAADTEVRDILDKGDAKLYPGFRFFRELRYGKLCNLVLTDYRTYRPDHPVKEDAFPGTVLFDEAAVRAKYRELFGDAAAARFDADRRLFTKPLRLIGPAIVDLENGNPSGLREYVPWALIERSQRSALTAQLAFDYQSSGFSPSAAQAKADSVLAGDLDVEYLNGIIDAYNDRLGAAIPRIPQNVDKRWSETKNPYGLTNYNLHKALLLIDFGSRYALNADMYELWRALAADAAGGTPADEDSYGEADFGSGQETWLKGAIAASDATWNIVASSVSSTSIIVDLENEDQLPPDGSLPDSGPGGANEQLEKLRRLMVLVAQILGLGTRIYVTCDHWDGQPSKRYELHRLYREKGNVVLVSGDIHSTWVNDFSTDEGKLFEFTGTSISSATASSLITSALGLDAAASASAIRPTGPASGFARALRALITHVREGLASGTLLARLDATRRGELTELMAELVAEAAGPQSVIDDLLAKLDLYFFDFYHESTYLKTAEGRSKVKSDLKGIDSSANGVVVVDVNTDSVHGTLFLINPADLATDYYRPRDREEFLATKVRVRRFLIEGGSLTEV